MNLTSIERKNMNKIINNYNQSKTNINEKNNINTNNKISNINMRKIETKKFGKKSVVGGGIANNLRNNISNTISLSSKLSDISEKLDKYENLINKLGKEFQ